MIWVQGGSGNRREWPCHSTCSGLHCGCMTAIAAVVEPGRGRARRIWLAGDSQVTVDDDIKLYTSDPKVWRVDLGKDGALVVGAAGDAECDSVMAGLDWTGGPSVWAKRIRAACAKVGCTDLTALIGYQARLYVSDGDTMWTVQGQCEAIGSGGDFARGYLQGSAGGDARRRVGAAVRGAARRNTYVGGRVKVVCTC